MLLLQVSACIILACFFFFQQLYSVHLVNEKVDCTTFMSDQIKLVVSACECITTDIGRLKVLIQVSWLILQSLCVIRLD